jgi:hypothetical protein
MLGGKRKEGHEGEKQQAIKAKVNYEALAPADLSTREM